MVGVAFRPVEINPDLSLGITIIFVVVLVFLYISRSLVEFLRVRKSNQELLKLSHEWHENGLVVTNWLKAHYGELSRDTKTILSYPEFQELLWKDFKIYERLVILDPKLKEDPIFNEGRAFYASLIKTENQKPS